MTSSASRSKKCPPSTTACQSLLDDSEEGVQRREVAEFVDRRGHLDADLSVAIRTRQTDSSRRGEIGG